MKRGRLRAVDEAILQRDAKAAPQEALSFRPPDNSPFRRHFTRGFLLCLYAYSTRFAWECQCPFCTNPLGRFALPSAGRAFGRRARFSLRQGRGAESLSAHRQRGGRIEYPLYAVDSTAFSRAPSNRPCFFRVPARRNRVSSAYRRTDRAFRALSDRLRFSHTPSDGRTEKRPRGRTLLRRGVFFAGSDLLRLLPNSLRISGRSRRGARKQ